MKIKLGALRKIVFETLALETDERMMGDGATNGFDDLGFPDSIALHLDSKRAGLGDDNADDDIVAHEIKEFFLQEQDASSDDEQATPTPGKAPEIKGFYTPFDMAKDHMGTDNFHGTWYKSPGQPAGAAGDPFRSEDPYAQLGFHPPAGAADPTTTPPSTTGETGVTARDVPEDESLKIDDTSKLGANKPSSDV